eukprot:Partr_v1_DN28574_c2_g1_i8_m73963 putative transcription factor SipA3
MTSRISKYCSCHIGQNMQLNVCLMKDQRRIYERMAERYENSLQKFASLSRLRESSSLREDAFQLHDLRKSYIRTSMEYSSRSIKFKYALDKIILERFTDSMDSIKDFYSNAADIYKSLNPRIIELKDGLRHRQSNYDDKLTALEQDRARLEEEAISESRPAAILPSMTFQPSYRVIVDSSTPKEKRGYLFKKITPKSPMLVPQWVRRWCYIQDGKFGFKMIAKSRGVIASVTPISVLLCEVKIDEKQDRRFTFEVISSKRSITLQAETEEEMMAWLNVFEAAKLHLVKQGHRVEDESSVDFKVPADDEDWEILSTPPLTRKRLGNSVRKSEYEMATGLKINYPSPEFEKRNEEMRSVMKDLAAEEVFIDSYPVTLMQDKPLLGRLYFTQHYVCFYSNILSFVTAFKIPVSDVLSIDKETEDQAHYVTIKTGTNSIYKLKPLNGDELRLYGSLNTIVWNEKGDNSLPVQELFDSIYENYKHMPRKQPTVEDEAPVKMSRATKSASPPSKNLTTQPSGDEIGDATDEPWPADVEAPSSEVKCGCKDHWEKVEADFVFEVPASKVYKVIWESDFLTELRKENGDWDVVLGEWSSDPQPQREMKWTLAINNPMVKQKETECVEVQKILKRDEHLCYIVEHTAKTVNMPYGDSFQTCARYCITYISKTSSRLVITIGITWFKSPFVKAIIKKEAMKGLSDSCQMFMNKTKAALMANSVTSGSGDEDSPKMLSNAPVPRPKQASIQGDNTPTYIASSWRYLLIFLIMSLCGNAVLFLRSSSHTEANHLSDRELRFMKYGVSLKEINESLQNISLSIGDSPRDVARQEQFNAYLKSPVIYEWYNKRLASVSMINGEMITYAQRLRASMIKSFDILNEMELTLHKSMYITWMRDQIMLCHKLRSDKKTLASKDQAKELEDLRVHCRDLEVDFSIFLMRNKVDG